MEDAADDDEEEEGDPILLEPEALIPPLVPASPLSSVASFAPK